ncbi:retrotransposon ORF1 [Tanacetum coccineum]|uniref:Retrotransposon ORF1 n=1 Tax=Tanacetum coccineum TaxID=301880 RepID=A0ABQ5IUI5_9ASTR
MDPNSSLGKICLGEDVVVISSDKVKGSGDWNSLEFQDTANSGQKKETKAMVFYQIDTEEVSDRFVAPCFVNGLKAYDGEINLGVDENMISNEYELKLCLKHEVKRGNKVVKRSSLSFLRMTKAITDFGAGTITIYPDIDPFLEETEEEEKINDDWDYLLDFNIDDIPLLGEEGLPPFEERPIIKTMAYHDKYKKILDEVWKDKVELDGKIVKEEEEAVKRIKGKTLKEKDDPGAFIFPIRLEGQVNENALEDTGSDINTMPYRIYEQSGREEMKKVDRGITMINHTQAEAMGILTNVLYHVGVTTLIAKFLILDTSIDRDSPIVVGQRFLRTIGGIVNTPERLFSTFDGTIKEVNWKPDYKGSYTKEEEATGQWRTEIRLTDPYGNIYLQGFTTKKMDRKLSKYHKLSDIMSPNLWEHTMMRPDHHDPNALDNMKPWKRYCFHKFTMSSCYGKDVTEMQSLEIDDMLRIRLREAGSDEEIFTSVAWIGAFNINEPIYAELCHEFYSTYEFDKVGLYQAVELKEEGFNVYFEGSLRSDEHFNAQDYWLSISREENLGLSRSHTLTIKKPILRVIHKMITYGLCQRTNGYDKVWKNDLWLLSMFDARHQNGYANVAWLIARWMKRKGAGTQKESQICCGQFISKIARKCRVLTEDVVRSLSASIYYRDLDTTTLRDLIDSDGKLIPKDPQPGVPRIGIPRPPRASMQDLYDMMGRMEISQEAIERMKYRQSYHWDRYQGVFEHMAGVYSIPLQEAYNPLGYAQPQYDQYYQQYPPPSPQYPPQYLQQQQHDDE